MARSLTSATASEYSPKFSPDSRWLAYVIDQQERAEVYVRGYPSGEPIPVSSSGGMGAVWSRDGRTLFYESAQSGGHTLMSVPVSVDGSRLKLGAPSPAVSLALAGGDEYGQSAYWGPEYDVFPNGDFVMLRGLGPALDLLEPVLHEDDLASTPCFWRTVAPQERRWAGRASLHSR